VLDQELTADDFEVIVVNDSGGPLLEEDWQRNNRVRILATNRRERCVARNAGASIACGKYLHFLDDDDWLLPEALQVFWTLTQRHPGASVFYGGAKLVDSVGHCLGELNLGRGGNCYSQLVAGSLIYSLALLVEAEAFFAVGGFNPLFRVTEDTDLWRRLALRFDFANTLANVGCALKGMGWSTSACYDDAVENNRRSRDMALSEEGAFARLQASASSSYWHGRVFQAYASATLWNLRRKRLLSAASRALFGMVSLVLSGRNALSSGFWHAVRDSQVPCTQARVWDPNTRSKS